TGAGQVARRQRADLTRAHEHGAAPLQRTQHLAGELDTGESHRDRGRADLGIGAHPLGHRKGALNAAREDAADGPGLLGAAEGLLDLAEDLRLADDHRVEAGADAKEVANRREAAILVEVAVDTRLALAQKGPRRGGPFLTANRGVDLQPVAGGDDHRLRDARPGAKLVQRLLETLGSDRHPFPDRDRRGVVRDADREDFQAVLHTGLPTKTPAKAMARQKNPIIVANATRLPLHPRICLKTKMAAVSPHATTPIASLVSWRRVEDSAEETGKSTPVRRVSVSRTKPAVITCWVIRSSCASEGRRRNMAPGRLVFSSR